MFTFSNGLQRGEEPSDSIFIAYLWEAGLAVQSCLSLKCNLFLSKLHIFHNSSYISLRTGSIPFQGGPSNQGFILMMLMMRLISLVISTSIPIPHTTGTTTLYLCACPCSSPEVLYHWTQQYLARSNPNTALQVRQQSEGGSRCQCSWSECNVSMQRDSVYFVQIR